LGGVFSTTAKTLIWDNHCQKNDSGLCGRRAITTVFAKHQEKPQKIQAIACYTINVVSIYILEAGRNKCTKLLKLSFSLIVEKIEMVVSSKAPYQTPITTLEKRNSGKLAVRGKTFRVSNEIWDLERTFAEAGIT
jgi:hypothetical protein